MRSNLLKIISLKLEMEYEIENTYSLAVTHVACLRLSYLSPRASHVEETKPCRRQGSLVGDGGDRVKPCRCRMSLPAAAGRTATARRASSRASRARTSGTTGSATRSTISTSGVHIVLRNHSLPITFFWTARLLVDIEGMFKIIC